LRIPIQDELRDQEPATWEREEASAVLPTSALQTVEAPPRSVKQDGIGQRRLDAGEEQLKAHPSARDAFSPRVASCRCGGGCLEMPPIGTAPSACPREHDLEFSLLQVTLRAAALQPMSIAVVYTDQSHLQQGSIGATFQSWR